MACTPFPDPPNRGGITFPDGPADVYPEPPEQSEVTKKTSWLRRLFGKKQQPIPTRREMQSLMEQVFSNETILNFRRGDVPRDARFTAKLGYPRGVFEIIGMQAARVMARAKKPRHLSMLHTISDLYHGVIDNLHVHGSDLEVRLMRLEDSVVHYLRSVRLKEVEADVRRQVAAFRRKNGWAS